ncbi:MAG: hypothetical protein WC658_03260, partial [Candidatus Omnitrophota bacterium]
KHPVLIGVYKASWADFSKRMDEQYDLIHQDPDKVLGSLDIGNVELDTGLGSAASPYSTIQKRESTSGASKNRQDNAMRNISKRSIELIKAMRNDLGRPVIYNGEERVLPIDIEVDLSLIDKKNAPEYAQMWAYLILGSAKQKNVNFVFTAPDYSGAVNLPEGYAENLKSCVTYEEFSQLLGEEISSKAGALGPGYNVDEFIRKRIRKSPETPSSGAVRILICPKERLRWMRDNNISLEEGLYPVALDGLNVTADGTALRNFEAAMAIGMCTAALVIAKRRDAERGSNEELPQLKKRILEKMRMIYRLFIERQDFAIDEETLSFMISQCPETRIDLAIYHALPPITRLSIEAIRERICAANLFLQAA